MMRNSKNTEARLMWENSRMRQPAANRYAYIVNYSHADVIQLRAHTETSVGVWETGELDIESEGSPDYDELETTGNESFTRYTVEDAVTTVRNESGKEAVVCVKAEEIVHQNG